MYISKIFYMNDNPKYQWGYIESKEDMQLASEVGIIAIQEDGETREDFFNRVDDRPTEHQYGCKQYYDEKVCNNNYPEVVQSKRCLDKFFCINDRELISMLIRHDLFLDKYIEHKDPTIRSEVYKRGGYDIEEAIKSEKDNVAYDGIVERLIKTDNYCDLIPINKLNLVDDLYGYFDLIYENREYVDDYDWLSEFYDYTYDKFGYYLAVEDLRQFDELNETIRRHSNYYY